jgi:hypothetical protein
MLGNLTQFLWESTQPAIRQGMSGMLDRSGIKEVLGRLKVRNQPNTKDISPEGWVAPAVVESLIRPASGD